MRSFKNYLCNKKMKEEVATDFMQVSFAFTSELN